MKLKKFTAFSIAILILFLTSGCINLKKYEEKYAYFTDPDKTTIVYKNQNYSELNIYNGFIISAHKKLTVSIKTELQFLSRLAPETLYITEDEKIIHTGLQDGARLPALKGCQTVYLRDDCFNLLSQLSDEILFFFSTIDQTEDGYKITPLNENVTARLWDLIMKAPTIHISLSDVENIDTALEIYKSDENGLKANKNEKYVLCEIDSGEYAPGYRDYHFGLMMPDKKDEQGKTELHSMTRQEYEDFLAFIQNEV